MIQELFFDEYGKLNDLAGPFKGLAIKKGRGEILKALKEKGLLKCSKQLAHNVGLHDRCNTPIEFNQSPQWSISVLGK